MIKLVNALGATKILPPSMSWRLNRFEVSRPNVRLYGDGAVPVGKNTIEPRQLTLSGSIFYPSKLQIAEEVDSIVSFLQHPPIQCYRKETDERYLICYPTAIPQEVLDGGAEIALDIHMTAFDPYWYGVETVMSASGLGPLVLDCANSGNAPTLPIIRGTVGGDILITNTNNGNKIELLGLIAGDSIYIDCANMYIAINGEPALLWANNEWLLYSLSLLPGNNKITVEGPGTKTIEITYRPRWY